MLKRLDEVWFIDADTFLLMGPRSEGLEFFIILASFVLDAEFTSYSFFTFEIRSLIILVLVL